jgi:hypothetical protein
MKDGFASTATSRLVETPRRAAGVTWADQSPDRSRRQALEQVLFVEETSWPRNTPAAWLQRRCLEQCEVQHRTVASSRRCTVLMSVLVCAVAVLLVGLVVYVFVRRIALDEG